MLAAVFVPLLVVAALLASAADAERRAQAMAGIFTVLAVVVFVVPAWGRGTNGLSLVPGGADAQGDLRFSIVPVMLLASAVAVLIAARRSGRLGPERIWQPAYAAQVALVVLVSFPDHDAAQR